MNLLQVRQELLENNFRRIETIKADNPTGPNDVTPSEIEIWQHGGHLVLIQSMDNDPSVIGSSKSFHVFKIAFTSLGYSDSPFLEDTRQMLYEAMGKRYRNTPHDLAFTRGKGELSPDDAA